MITIYGMRTSGNCYKLQLLLDQLGRAYRWVDIDIALYAYTHCAADGGFELSAFPNIGRWLARVRSQPGYTPMRNTPL